MQEYCIVVMKPEEGYTYHQRITFKSAAPTFKEAVISFIKKREEYHDHFILEAETLAPVTFDATVYLKGGNFAETGKPYPNDFFACTFSEFEKQATYYQNDCEIFDHFSSSAFCRVLRSRSGKAGEFFTMHNERFRDLTMKYQKDLGRPVLKFGEYGKAFREGNFLNSPNHYFQ